VCVCVWVEDVLIRYDYSDKKKINQRHFLQ